jgi:hypothetical protein
VAPADQPSASPLRPQGKAVFATTPVHGVVFGPVVDQELDVAVDVVRA